MVNSGFVKIRAGLVDHLISGRLGFFEVGIYLALHLQADFEKGLWIGSAPRLMATAPRGATLRSIQRALERLEDVAFIRCFLVQGKRGNYPVLIHKYEPAFGALKGYRLNAMDSDDWRNPKYELVADVSQTTRRDDADDDTDVTPSPELDSRNQTKKKPAGAKAAPFVLPEWVPTDPWSAFEEMRRAKGKRYAMTDRARQLIVTELGKLRDAGHDPKAVLERSVRRSWLDVFPLDRTDSMKGTFDDEFDAAIKRNAQ